MGSWCSLSINKYAIDHSKSYINPFWALIFQESDRRIKRVHYSEYYTKQMEQDSEEVDSIEYATTKRIISNRLELQGHSLEASIAYYDEGYSKLINEWMWHDDKSFDYGLNNLETLKKIGFYGWVDIVRKIIKENLKESDLDINRNRSKDDLCTFIIDYLMPDCFLGYPTTEYGLALRAILEAMDESDEIVIDVTSLVSGGYYEKHEPICTSTINTQLESSLPFQKIIILTEGSTDTNILSRSLRLLYPHLKDYFSFLDFNGARPEPGTSGLERTVKSFAASGIHNKMIALFDNDTTGLGSCSYLKSKTTLPSNIKIITLPTLEFAKSYPTIGPQGMADVDINDRACSIELYLGKEAITDESGNYIPVQWTGFDHRQNAYQGEITRKGEIQKKFESIVSTIEKDPTKMALYSWSDLRLIFESLFRAAAEMASFNNVILRQMD